MTTAFIKFLKIWLVLLTVWLTFITAIFILAAVLTANVSYYDPKAMFTQWSGNDLRIGNASGQFFVTHFKDVNRHSFAELPKPLLVASSGGVLIPHSELTKLTWIIPPDMHDTVFPATTNQTVTPPAIGAPIEALYLFPATAKFNPK